MRLENWAVLGGSIQRKVPALRLNAGCEVGSVPFLISALLLNLNIVYFVCCRRGHGIMSTTSVSVTL